MGFSKWKVRGPHARVGFKACPNQAPFHIELAKVPGVKAKGVGWCVPYNALEVVGDIADLFGMELVYAVWETPPGVPTTWAAVKERLEEEGEVQDWVLEGFLKEYQESAIAFGWPKSGVHLWHTTGCLTGDAELVCNRAGRSFRLQLRDLVHRFNGGECGRWGKGYRWDSTIPTRTASEEEGFLRLNEVVAAYATGSKEVFAVKAGSSSLRATAEHRFLTPEGYKQLRELGPGSLVGLRGRKTRSRKAPKLLYVLRGVRHHPHAQVTCHKLSESVRKSQRRLPGATTLLYRVPEHRLVVEADMNALSLPEFVGRCQEGEIEGLSFLDPALVVHHRDRNPKNNALENLAVLTEAAHAALHRSATQGLYAVQWVEVESITACGKEETFDLTMKGPQHSYVANGFVVHNSGKTLTGLITALSVPGPIVIITRAASRLQFGREVQRFTHLQPYIVRPAGERKGLKEVNGETWAMFFSRLMPEMKKAALVGQAWKDAKAEHGVLTRRSGTLDQYMKKCKEKNRRPVVIVGWEALTVNMVKLKKVLPAVLIVDECFPAGTPVLTRRGPVGIESICVGEEVLSCSEGGCLSWKKVVRRIERRGRGRGLVDIKHENGWISCTPEHKLWVQEVGYVEASCLRSDHYLLFVREGVRVLEEAQRSDEEILFSSVRRAPAQRSEEGKRRDEVLPCLRPVVSGLLRPERPKDLLQSKLRRGPARELDSQQGEDEQAGESSARALSGRRAPPLTTRSGVGYEREDEDEQSDEERCCEGEGQQAPQGVRTQAASTRREWEAPSCPTTKATGCSGEPLGTGSDCSGGGSSSTRVPSTPLVRGGHRVESWDGCSGGRWDEPQQPEGEGSRREERLRLIASRVERVESQESGSDGGSSFCGTEGERLYDLEVAGNHNYFAWGVLVSNCHNLSSSKRYEVVFLPELPDVPVLNPEAIESLRRVDPDGAREVEEHRARLVKKLRDMLREQSKEAKELGGFLAGGTNEDPDRKMMVPYRSAASSAAELSRLASVLKRISLTATPIRDRVRNLYSQLDIIEPNCWGNTTKWMDRHTARKPGRYGGYDTTGESRLPELKQRLSTTAHILSYAETHSQLPPKRRQSFYVAPSDQVRPTGGFSSERKAASKRGPSAILEVSLAEAASKKKKAVLGLIEDHVSVGQKVVVFTGRRRDCEALGKSVRSIPFVKGRKGEGGVQVWVAHGGQSQKMRDEIVRGYMAHPGPCVLVGTGPAFGESLNIHETDAALFVMLPYTPGQLRQWEGRFCVHEGQMVPTQQGVKRVEAVVPGDWVLSHKGRWCPVSAVRSRNLKSAHGGRRSCLVTLNIWGTPVPLALTADHKVLCSIDGGSPEWVEAGRVCPGDELVTPRLTLGEEGTVLQLQFPSRCRVNPRRVKNKRYISMPEWVEVDEDVAWLMGHFAGDGWTSASTSHYVGIASHEGQREGHLARAEQVFLRWGIKAKYRKASKGKGLNLYAYGKELALWFRSLFGKTSREKQIPPFVFTWPQLLVKAFLDGYWDADGYRKKDGEIQWTTVSPHLAYGMLVLSAAVGAPVGTYLAANGQYSGSINPRSKMRIDSEFLYRKVRSSDCRFARGDERQSKVYDLQVERDESFVVEGVAVHNCRLGQTRPCTIYYVIAEGTVDEHLASILIEKLPAVEAVVRDTELAEAKFALAGFNPDESEEEFALSVLGDMDF